MAGTKSDEGGFGAQVLISKDKHVAGRVREHVEGLEAEVNVLRRLDHPNIVRYLVRRLHGCSQIWHEHLREQAGGRALEWVEDTPNSAWLLSLSGFFSTLPHCACTPACKRFHRAYQTAACRLSRLALAPLLLCHPAREKSVQALYDGQGTDRDDEHLNIFLEFVPGGSIASLLNKFGEPLAPVSRAHAYLHAACLGQERSTCRGLGPGRAYGKAFA